MFEVCIDGIYIHGLTKEQCMQTVSENLVSIDRDISYTESEINKLNEHLKEMKKYRDALEHYIFI